MNHEDILKNSIQVGFWREKKYEISILPFPCENSSNYIEGFIENFKLLQDEVIKNGKYYNYHIYKKCYTCNDNRDDRIKKLYLIQYKGLSDCRICSCRNGSSTIYLNGYEFPSGYFHYVDSHNIKVPLEFQQMICNLEL